MEQDSIYNLIELLKSQLHLYTEIKDILVSEREAVVAWRIQDTSKFNKDKERLTRKERLLEEARLTIAQRIQNEKGLPDASLSSIISVCSNESQGAELTDLKQRLLETAQAIAEETSVLKVLYSTNLKLINEMYAQMGYLSTNKYGADPLSHVPGTISAIG